jgi:hypothetical protein
MLTAMVEMASRYHRTQLFSIAMGSHNLFFFLPELAWNCSPPDLSFPGRLDYRCEPSVLGFNLFFNLVKVDSVGLHSLFFFKSILAT